MTRTHQRYREYVEDQRRFFDELVTEDWDSYHDEAWDRARKAEVDAVFRRVSPRTVLDIGCGVGFHDQYMASLPGVERVLAIDYSTQSIAAARRTYPHDRVTYRTADLFEMGSGDFDLVVSFHVIEHVNDPTAFLTRCAELAAVSGYVAVVTPNVRRLDNRLRVLLGRTPVLLDPQHFEEYAPQRMRELGSAVGLSHVATFGGPLQLVAPRLQRQVIPERLGRRLGRRAASLATTYAVVFRAGSP